MTPLARAEELMFKHKDIKGYVRDNETYHCEWDDLVADLLRESGHEDVAKLFDRERQYFWYA